VLTKNTFYLIVALASILVTCIQSHASAHDLAAEMSAAATAFFDALDESAQAKISFTFDDENREGWHFIPKERPGLPIGELTIEQHDLAMTLLQTALSHRGLETSKQIMALESVLHEMENGNPKRDPAKYNFYFFGKPSNEQPWGWRIEGHHLSINITIAGGEVLSTTPAFMGASPAEVPVGKRKGFRALALQEAKAARLEPLGIAASEMTEQQQAILNELIDCYLDNFRTELCESDRKKIEAAGVENIHFAWAGFIQPKKPHYYRVQGPTFIFEYDNSQNNANHVHTMWRDTENDFGENLLKRHYEKVPHGASP